MLLTAVCLQSREQHSAWSTVSSPAHSASPLLHLRSPHTQSDTGANLCRPPTRWSDPQLALWGKKSGRLVSDSTAHDARAGFKSFNITHALPAALSHITHDAFLPPAQGGGRVSLESVAMWETPLSHRCHLWCHWRVLNRSWDLPAAKITQHFTSNCFSITMSGNISARFHALELPSYSPSWPSSSIYRFLEKASQFKGASLLFTGPLNPLFSPSGQSCFNSSSELCLLFTLFSPRGQEEHLCFCGKKGERGRMERWVFPLQLFLQHHDKTMCQRELRKGTDFHLQRHCRCNLVLPSPSDSVHFSEYQLVLCK